MNECLVTKLKGVVNNSTLPVIDKVVFRLTGEQISIKITPASGKTIAFSGSDGSERAFGADTWLSLTPNVSYTASSAGEITGIEAATYVGDWPKGLMQVPGLTIFTYKGEINTQDLPSPESMATLKLYDRDVDSTENLITWLQGLKTGCNVNLQGKAQGMPYIPMATIATFAGGTATFNVVSSTAEGSIEEFVNVRRTVFDQSTGSLSFKFLYFDPVTFNGVRIVAPASGDTQQLSWTADTITFDGVTITA